MYSIWICMGENVPKKEENTVSLYEVAKNDIIGEVERAIESYDLLSVVVIRVSSNVDAGDELLALLQLLFSKQVSKREKLEGLKQMGLQIDDEITKGVEKMCTLGEELVESTAKEVTRQMVLKMYKKHMPLEDIAEVSDVSVRVIKDWLEEESIHT